MIKQFGSDSCLLLIDVQEGVDDLSHWGGATGRRNNPNAETNMLKILNHWRKANLPVAFTLHDSREQNSPLKLSEPGGKQKPGFIKNDGDIVIVKDVNSGFIGTSLEVELRRAGIQRLIITGFFTNFCVETTTRMAGNLGFDTYLIDDCCATTNRVSPNGTDFDPELVHNMSIANLHGEFCTALNTELVLELIQADNNNLQRAQGNE